MLPLFQIKKYPNLAILMCVVFFALPGRSSAGDIEFIDAPDTGVELGVGWDSATSTVVASRCVKYAPIQEGGQLLQLDLQEASDSSELAETLDISANTSINGLMGSGSARASIAKDRTVKASSTTFSLRATAQNGVMFAGPLKPLPDRRFAFSTMENRVVPNWMKDEMKGDQETLSVALEPWAKGLLKPTQSASAVDSSGIDSEDPLMNFRKHCGDHFIAAITSGAEALAVITFETHDESTKQKLSAQISASYSIASVAGEVNLDKSAEASQSHLKVSFTQIGGARGEIPTTNEDLVRKLKVLAAEAAEAPMFYEIGIMAYEDLPGWPLEPSGAKGTDQALTELLSKRDLQMFSLYNTLESVLEEPDQYGVGGDKELFPPRLWVLEGLQDKVLEVRQKLAEFQQERQKLELKRLAGRSLLDITELKRIGQALVNFHLTEKDQVPSRLPRCIDTESKTYEDWKEKVRCYLETVDVPRMRLWLPLPSPSPQEMVGAPNGPGGSKEQDSNYAAKVVEHYVGQQARRICKRDPTSKECLTNGTLREMETLVLPNYQQLYLRDRWEGYLFSTNAELIGCLHADRNAQSTTIQEVRPRDGSLQEAGCTLFSLQRAADTSSALHLKTEDLYLTRDRAEISLTQPDPKLGPDTWVVRFNNKLANDKGTDDVQCLTAEGNRRVGAANCSSTLVGWFFVPKVFLPWAVDPEVQVDGSQPGDT